MSQDSVFPYQRSVCTGTEPVSLTYPITYLRKHNGWARAETTFPLIVIAFMLLLTVNYPLPTHVRAASVCSFYFLSNPRDSSDLLSPVPLIYHQWISRPLPPALFIVMHKIRCHFLEHFLNLLRFCFSAIIISLAQINSKIHKGLGVSYVDIHQIRKNL